MQKVLGRPLQKDEVIHHLNGDKSDNRIENLVVLKTTDHNHLHRPPKTYSDEMVECGCGCGAKFAKYDNRGRERKYATPGCAWRGKPHGRGNPNRKKAEEALNVNTN
jgi:hypothetical protein